MIITYINVIIGYKAIYKTTWGGTRSTYEATGITREQAVDNAYSKYLLEVILF